MLLHFRQIDLRLIKQKCQFLVKSVDYLSYIIDQLGIYPFEGKVKAVKAAPNLRTLQNWKFIWRYLPTMANFFWI